VRGTHRGDRVAAVGLADRIVRKQHLAVHGEQRWPASLTVLILIVLPFLLPNRYGNGALRWILLAFELGLLIAITLLDPGRIDRRSNEIRALSIALTVVLVLVALAATARLVAELLDGAPRLNSADTLLRTGGLVWLDTILTFALLYWELDGGGSAARRFNKRPYPDLAFPEQLNPAVAPPEWQPIFVDYLYLGFTNAVAFSPTDVMPLARWAKMLMTLQSLTSIVILTLVIANAVNILS
jgi:uncharacterized membrane protein